ncbi:MAG: aa3-type cytochrome c oxidase subunit IV [Pseudomonadota bacterium]
MAEDASENWSDTMDRPEHENTYALFGALVKWSTIVIVIILILMAIFLV